MEETEERRTMRRPLMFQVDSINEDKKTIERNKMLVENPIGSSFKVSNGKFLCDIIINECGVTVKCKDKTGNVEVISTRNVCL